MFLYQYCITYISFNLYQIFSNEMSNLFINLVRRSQYPVISDSYTVYRFDSILDILIFRFLSFEQSMLETI